LPWIGVISARVEREKSPGQIDKVNKPVEERPINDDGNRPYEHVPVLIGKREAPLPLAVINPWVEIKRDYVLSSVELNILLVNR
jgi:hypothetical protein